MFSFVIWMLGLAIIGFMGIANLAVLAMAFEKHFLLGIAAIAATALFWLFILAVFA